MSDLIAYLVSNGVVGFLAMDTAVQHMRRVGGRLTSSILDTTGTSPTELLKAVSAYHGIGYATDALLASIDPDVPQFWHHDNALRLGAMPLAIDTTGLTLGVLEPLTQMQLEEIREEYGSNITQLLMLEFRFFELCHRFFDVVLDHRYALWVSRFPLDHVEPLEHDATTTSDDASPFFSKEAPKTPAETFADPFADLFIDEDTQTCAGETVTDDAPRTREDTTDASNILDEQQLEDTKPADSTAPVVEKIGHTDTIETDQTDAEQDDDQHTGEIAYDGSALDPALADALLGTEESFHAAFDFGGDVGWSPSGSFAKHAKKLSEDSDATRLPTDVLAARIPTDITDLSFDVEPDADEEAAPQARPLTTAPQPLVDEPNSPSKEFSEDDELPLLSYESSTPNDSLDSALDSARRRSQSIQPVRFSEPDEGLPPQTQSGLHPKLPSNREPSHTSSSGFIRPPIHGAVDTPNVPSQATAADISLARRLGLVDEQDSWSATKRRLDAYSERERSVAAELTAIDIRDIYQRARSIDELLDATLKYFGGFFQRRFFMHFWQPLKSSGLLMQGVRDNTTPFSSVEIPYDDTATVYKMRETANYLQGSPVEIGFQTLYSRLGIERADEIIAMPISHEGVVVMMLLMDNGPHRALENALGAGEIALILQQLSQAMTQLAARTEASAQKLIQRATPVSGTPSLESTKRQATPISQSALVSQPVELSAQRVSPPAWDPEALIDPDLLTVAPIPPASTDRLEAAMDSMELQTVDADESDEPRLDSVEHIFQRPSSSPRRDEADDTSELTHESTSLEIEVRPGEELSPTAKALLEQDTQRSDKRAVGIIISDDERSADDLARDLFPPTPSERIRLRDQTSDTDANSTQKPASKQHDAPSPTDDDGHADDQPPTSDKTQQDHLANEAAKRRAASAAAKRKSKWKAKDLAKLLNVGSVEIPISEFDADSEPQADVKLDDTAEQKPDAKIGDTAEQKADVKLDDTAEQKPDEKIGDTAEQKPDAKISDTAEQPTDHVLDDMDTEPEEDLAPVEVSSALSSTEFVARIFDEQPNSEEDSLFDGEQSSEEDDDSLLVLEQSFTEAFAIDQADADNSLVTHLAASSTEATQTPSAVQDEESAKASDREEEGPQATSESSATESVLANEQELIDAFADEVTAKSTPAVLAQPGNALTNVEDTNDQHEESEEHDAGEAGEDRPQDEARKANIAAQLAAILRERRGTQPAEDKQPDVRDTQLHDDEQPDILESSDEGESETLIFSPQTFLDPQTSVGSAPPPPPAAPNAATPPASRTRLKPPPAPAPPAAELDEHALKGALEEVSAQALDVDRIAEVASSVLPSPTARPAATLVTLDDLTESQRRMHTSDLETVSPALDELLFGDEATSAAALERLRSPQLTELPSVLAAFPGPLLLDRSKVDEEHRPLAEHGPLLALVDAHLHDYLPELWSCLERRSSDARYYALRFLALIRDLELRYVLLETVFDDDLQVRRLALRLIETQRNSPDYVMALDTLRSRTKDANPAHRGAAVSALTQLRDVDGLEGLIDVLSDSAPQVRKQAREGLKRMTFIDCGETPEAWLEWFRIHGRELPEQWLVDAMVAMEPLRRELAARALEQIPNLVVNYHPEMSNQGLMRAKMTVERFFGLRR